MRKSRFAEEQIMGFLKQAEAGMPVKDLCRKEGFNDVSRPTQNGNIESFNGKFRDECLNEHWFESLQRARIALAAWRQDYNEVWPHSSCQRMPPAQFAARHRQQTADATLPKVDGTV